MDAERDAKMQIEDMERAGERVDRAIDDARSDWQSKQADNSVPGAVGGQDEDGEEESDGGAREESDGDAEA